GLPPRSAPLLRGGERDTPCRVEACWRARSPAAGSTRSPHRAPRGRIVWQYGRTDRRGRGPDRLATPDGMDLVPLGTRGGPGWTAVRHPARLGAPRLPAR